MKGTDAGKQAPQVGGDSRNPNREAGISGGRGWQEVDHSCSAISHGMESSSRAQTATAREAGLSQCAGVSEPCVGGHDMSPGPTWTEL